MENQQTNQQPQTPKSPSRLTKIIYNAAMFIIGIVLAALFFTCCDGENMTGKKTESALGAELKKQYEGLQSEYIKLQGHNEKINNELKIKFIELSDANNKVDIEHKKYVSAYNKGRNLITSNPCNDSLHLAVYDTLNSRCNSLHSKDSTAFRQAMTLFGMAQTKTKTQDSIITNRNDVIKLDALSIALYRDSLSTAKINLKDANKKGNRKAIKAFFVGAGVGAAATGAAVIIK